MGALDQGAASCSLFYSSSMTPGEQQGAGGIDLVEPRRELRCGAMGGLQTWPSHRHLYVGPWRHPSPPRTLGGQVHWTCSRRFVNSHGPTEYFAGRNSRICWNLGVAIRP
jgi:hypothetical protein